jgi:L-asparagine oxygenase
MEKSISETVRCRGYSFTERLDPDASSISIATAIGRPMSPWGGKLVQRLIPRATDTPNTYSGIYGLGRFPFHTDLAHWKQPPRYLMLRCIKGHANVPTLLLDGRVLVDRVTRDLLVRAVMKPRRPQNGLIPLLLLYEATESGYRLRWDETFIQPAGRIGVLATQRIAESLTQVEPQSVSLRWPGDTILIDNWQMLHARSQVPVGSENRIIERIYLESLN